MTETTRLVTCAGEVALEVANGALESFENGQASDTVTAAADLAAKALDELARHTEVSTIMYFYHRMETNLHKIILLLSS